ncbi:MAG: fumarylacetoacetase [Vulcanimicrobiaceae bacterium]
MNGDFPLENLPFGIFSRDGEPRRVGVAFGDDVVDLSKVARSGEFEGLFTNPAAVFESASLNAFLATGHGAWQATRERLQTILRVKPKAKEMLVPRAQVRMHMPIEIGDYVDFYSSIEHATNVGKLFRPGGDPILPNYRHIPVGYHGRTSTVSIAERVRRPNGQTKAADAPAPAFGPSRQLDFELELGFIVGLSNDEGRPIAPDDAADHLFGIVLLSDWSARDLQSWEGQPLGPFLSKSFATTISPWVVTLDALAPYRVANRPQDPEPLEYLRVDAPWALDIELSVSLQSRGMQHARTNPKEIARVNFRNMYWNAAQQLAHLTSNGSIIRPGDLLGSGTISGTEEGSYGSLLEATFRGARPLSLSNGETRTFLEDGDTIVMQGVAALPGLPRIGFGELRATVAPTEW